jgi:hypothetical protein
MPKLNSDKFYQIGLFCATISLLNYTSNVSQNENGIKQILRSDYQLS